MFYGRSDMAMFSLSIPTKDTPDYTYNTDLDGTEFKLNFRYDVRESCWYLSLYNMAGVLLMSNAKVVPWLSLIFPFARETIPKGNIIVVPKTTSYPSSPEITLENFSTDFYLYYVAATE